VAIIKKPQTVNEYAYAARIYYDDIVEIVSILKELNPSEIKISSDNFIFDNIEDLLDFGKKRISTLTITSCNPYIGIEFRPNYIRLFSAEDKHEIVGAIHKIRLFLKTKRPFFAFHIHMYRDEFLFMALYSLLTIGCGLTIVLYFKPPMVYAILYGFVMHFLVMTYYFVVYTINYSSIFLIKQAEYTSFFARKKDDIFVGIIVGAILAVLGYVFSQLLGYK
jgi:hypothetical protein